MEKIYVVTDLGPGDGGKGGVVHWLANTMKASVVIKRGGAQGSHGVRTSRGESFNFSQWGCGTLEGIPTFISNQMVIMPTGLKNESEALRRQCGINNPFKLLQADPTCIVSTPYHKISSQVKELACGDNPRGTIGTGVGEAYRYAERCPELTLLASDLVESKVWLREKLSAVRERIVRDLAEVLDGEFLEQDLEILGEITPLLSDDGFLDYCTNLFVQVGREIRFATLEEVLQKPGCAVVECSHGILTDAERGLRPHTSAIRTLPEFTTRMLREAGFGGQIVNLGIHRAYTIRHGAGPIPTADPAMNEDLLPGSHKDVNRWQGEIRVGALDIPLLNHAIGICGEGAFDGFCLTWFDQIVRNGEWKICVGYQEPVPEFSTEGLARAIPIYETHKVPQSFTKNLLPQNTVRELLFDWCREILERHITIPVRFVSIGATEADKICK